MTYFAALSNNIVQNIITAETHADAEIATGLSCIKLTGGHYASIGFSYDSETDSFINPNPVVEEEPIA